MPDCPNLRIEELFFFYCCERNDNTRNNVEIGGNLEKIRVLYDFASPSKQNETEASGPLSVIDFCYQTRLPLTDLYLTSELLHSKAIKHTLNV